MKRAVASLAASLAVVLATAPQAATVHAQIGDPRSVAVQPADSLLEISLFYGTAPADLSQQNNLSQKPIGAGQLLVVPTPELPAPPSDVNLAAMTSTDESARSEE